jgi:amidase
MRKAYFLLSFHQLPPFAIMSPSQRDYRTIAAEKRLERSNRIPQKWLIEPETFRTFTNVLQVPVTCGILNEAERSITSDHDATALLEELRAGVWSAEQVTVAFCKRAAIAQQLVSHSSSFTEVVTERK